MAAPADRKSNLLLDNPVTWAKKFLDLAALL
jgi:hypothetical protein